PREGLGGDGELRLRDAHRHVDRPITARLARDVSADGCREAMRAHERRREVFDVFREIAAAHEHRLRRHQANRADARGCGLGAWPKDWGPGTLSNATPSGEDDGGDKEIRSAHRAPSG